MARKMIVEEVDAVSGDAHVCHYDELDEEAKQRFPSAVGSGEVPVEEELEDLRDCDLVKFTSYYAVEYC